MNKAKQLIDRLEAQHSLSVEEYEYLIENQSDELAAYAAEKAFALRKQVYGTDVYIRGLIEIGNICRNDCYYCGIRRSNTACDRYRLTEAQILDCAREGYLVSAPLSCRAARTAHSRSIWFAIWYDRSKQSSRTVQ